MKKLIQAFTAMGIATMMASTTLSAQETNPYDLFNKKEQPSPPQNQNPFPPQPSAMGGMRKLPLVADCGPIDTIMKKIRAFGEVQMTISDSVIQIPGNSPQANVVKGDSAIYVNPKTGSYSVIFYLPDEMAKLGYGVEACVTSAGLNLSPGLQGVDI